MKRHRPLQEEENMPARPRAHADRHGSGWRARWIDEHGGRQSKGGFTSKGGALEYADERLQRVQALNRGDLIPASHRPQTVDALLDTFIDKHGATVDPATKRKLTRELRRAHETFGDRHPDSLNRLEIEDWRATLAAGSQHNVFRSFRQALAWGHARGLTEREPSQGIRNPKRKRHERREIVPFEAWDEIEAVCDELDERYRAIPIFATGTGLRTAEWIALERSDIDRENRLVRVCKRVGRGDHGLEVKQGTKTVPERFVPLRQRVLDALDAMPPRIDTRILFPAPRGGYIDLEKWRWREWTPALRAAGLQARGPYTMRHTFATWAIEDGSIPLPQVATIMGTSIRELEDTYHRWLRRTDERLLAALDAYDAGRAASA
jgi:integrase